MPKVKPPKYKTRTVRVGPFNRHALNKYVRKGWEVVAERQGPFGNYTDVTLRKQK